jgi:hypothetical protein
MTIIELASIFEWTRRPKVICKSSSEPPPQSFVIVELIAFQVISARAYAAQQFWRIHPAPMDPHRG